MESRKSLGLGLIIGLLIGLSLFFGLYFGLPNSSCEEDQAEEKEMPSYNEYGRAAVAADAGPCSVIGNDILLRDGSAVDGAIAAMLCVGLYNAQSTGIGGGSFMNVYDATTGETVFINSREVAPLTADKDMYDGDRALSYRGASSIAVPGEVAGYWEAHQRFGKLEWKDLFEPSIKLAAEGYEVNSALARAIRSRESMIRTPEYNLESVFTHANGSLKQEGDIIYRPALAVTLRKIAEEGAYTFYNGSLAKEIIADITDAPGAPSRVTEEDLKVYRVKIEKPINISLDDMTVFSPGAPSGGPVLCLILNILKGYKFSEESMKDVDSRILTYHRIVEAFKFAYARRTQLGDPGFDDEIEKLVMNMTSDFYAEGMRMKINDSSTQPVEFYKPDHDIPPEDGGSSHLSIVSEDGSSVSMTSTINEYFGSSVRGLRTGIIFNDEMNDFSSPNITNIYGVPRFPTNFIEPGKRPLSSMSPTIVIRNNKATNNKATNSALKMVAGASGGTTITTGTSLVIMNSLWFGENADIAVAMERVHHQLLPDAAKCEVGFNKEIIDGLKEKNHVVTMFKPSGSVVQAILRSADGTLGAKCDERKSGYPDGY